MEQLATLVENLTRSGKGKFWQGKTSIESIDQLEGLLNTKLPASYRQFLAEYGGGGLVGEEISGIEDDDATLDFRGTVLGDTYQCRSQFALPSHLIVIYYRGDAVVWCLDTSSFVGNECPVVSFNVTSKETRRISETFEGFFEEYVTLRCQKTPKTGH